jgi:hypothetical protein
MGAAAATRASRHTLARTFDAFWADHLAIVEPAQQPQRDEPLPSSGQTLSKRGADL